MTIFKTAAIASIVAAATLGAGMTAANAGKKHHHHHHHHHMKKNFHHHHGVVIVGSSHYSCKHWLRKYKRTGNPFFLNRYYACKY